MKFRQIWHTSPIKVPITDTIPIISFQIQNNDGEGQLKLPTYWEAVNIPSSLDLEASSLNWEAIDNNKVFYSEENYPPPAYAEIIESTFTKDSGNDSYIRPNKENENAGDLPPRVTYESSWFYLIEKWFP